MAIPHGDPPRHRKGEANRKIRDVVRQDIRGVGERNAARTKRTQIDPVVADAVQAYDLGVWQAVEKRSVNQGVTEADDPRALPPSRSSAAPLLAACQTRWTVNALSSISSTKGRKASSDTISGFSTVFRGWFIHVNYCIGLRTPCGIAIACRVPSQRPGIVPADKFRTSMAPGEMGGADDPRPGCDT